MKKVFKYKFAYEVHVEAENADDADEIALDVDLRTSVGSYYVSKEITGETELKLIEKSPLV